MLLLLFNLCFNFGVWYQFILLLWCVCPLSRFVCMLFLFDTKSMADESSNASSGTPHAIVRYFLLQLGNIYWFHYSNLIVKKGELNIHDCLNNRHNYFNTRIVNTIYNNYFSKVQLMQLIYTGRWRGGMTNGIHIIMIVACFAHQCIGFTGCLYSLAISPRFFFYVFYCFIDWV